MWVRYLDPDPSGLAQMLGGIVEANLTAHPEWSRMLKRPATYAIRVVDAGVDVSLRLAPGRVLVRNGLVGRPAVVIEADAETLTGLSRVPLRFGLPDATTEEGREVVRKMLRRRLRVRGALLNPGKLARLNRLLSVG